MVMVMVMVTVTVAILGSHKVYTDVCMPSGGKGKDDDKTR